MRRFPDWPERLDRVVEAARARAFEWGVHDCCLFACDCVRAMTGTDPAIEYRGLYRSRLGAYRRLRAISGGGVEEAAVRAFGAPLATVLIAGRGDVALIATRLGDALGIVTGELIAAAAPGGLAFAPLDSAAAAWRI